MNSEHGTLKNFVSKKFKFCSKSSKEGAESTKRNEESESNFKKKEGFIYKLRQKSGALCIILHQSFSLGLFFSFETRIYFENWNFPELLIPGIAGILLLLCVTLMYICVNMDPGVQPKKSESHQQSESDYYNTHRKGPAPVIRPMIYYGHNILGNYCFTCRHFKHPKTFHCEHCDRCIIRYDHHCTVLDCCVGIRNFPVYFYLMFFIVFFYLYITCYSVKVFVQVLFQKEKQSTLIIHVLQRVSILWITILSFSISLFCDVCHLILFPAVYLYVTAHGKTARELFFVVETHGHHCKCYKVIKSIQGFRESSNSTDVGCCRMLKNLRKFLCAPIPPSLLKDKNYYAVCDLDEVTINKKIDADDANDGVGDNSAARSKSESDLLYVYKQELAYKIAETRKISCCKF